MKVSDEDLHQLGRVVEDHTSGLYTPAFQDLRAELMALRKVAKEAVSAVSIAYTQGEPRAKWEPLLAALREAGL